MRQIIAVVFTAFAASALAQGPSLELQSDWLELVKGHRDGKTGAEVMGVEKDARTGSHTVMVKVPKTSMGDDANVEEVRVVGRAPEKAEMPDVLPDLETEWVDDYDNDHYGLIVRLKEDQKLPFRLFFSAEGQGGSIEGGAQP